MARLSSVHRGETVCVAALLIVLAACNTGAVRKALATQSAPRTAAVGETVSSNNWQFTVTKVERVSEFTWSSFGNVERAKGVWVIASLTLRNIADRNFGIGEHDFELRDGSGVRYSACVSFACSSLLRLNGLSTLGSTEQFPPGVDVRTAVSFDVNPSATGLRLILKQADQAMIDLGAEAAPPAAATPLTAAPLSPAVVSTATSPPVPAATPQALTCLTIRPANLDVPWTNLASAVSSGSSPKAADLAAAMVRKPLVLDSRGTSYPVAFRVSIQASAGAVTVFALIPRFAVADGVPYSPYGRWETMDEIPRRNFLLGLLNDAGAAYPSTPVSAYIFRYDGSPLGEGTNSPSLRFGVVLPGFTNAACLPAPSATLRP